MSSSADEEKKCCHCSCGHGEGGHGEGEGQGGCEDGTRRQFLTLSAAALGAAGAAGAAWPLINSMNPAADTLAMATTEVDVSNVKEGESLTVMWRGKPVFIRRRTPQEIEEARAVDAKELRDPETDQARFKQSAFGGKEMPEWLVVVGVCTHLGCVPLGQKPTDPKGEYDGWFCPCHGSQYDSAARIRKGPAPKNLEVPPYQFVDATHIKIG